MVDGSDDGVDFCMRNPERGFTLIELLIAIFIFGIVISSVYGAYRATFTIVHGSEYQLEIANKARVVAERLQVDLGSVVLGTGVVFRGERHTYADSVGDNLLFVSSAHLVLRENDTFAGHTLIQYESELDMNTGLLNVYRTEMALLPGMKIDDFAAGKTGQKLLICQGLREFRFTYRDRNGNETEEWLVDETAPPDPDGSPEGAQFPVLVAIEFSFAKSVDSAGSTHFKTAVALPQPWRKQG